MAFGDLLEPITGPPGRIECGDVQFGIIQESACTGGLTVGTSANPDVRYSRGTTQVRNYIDISVYLARSCRANCSVVHAWQSCHVRNGTFLKAAF